MVMGYGSLVHRLKQKHNHRFFTLVDITDIHGKIGSDANLADITRYKTILEYKINIFLLKSQ